MLLEVDQSLRLIPRDHAQTVDAFCLDVNQTVDAVWTPRVWGIVRSDTKRATVPVVMYVEAGQFPTVQGITAGGIYNDWFVVTLVGYFIAL